MEITFSSREHPSLKDYFFQLELSDNEKSLALKKESGVGFLANEWRMAHILGNMNMLCEQEHSWYDKFPSRIRYHFPWLGRDTYLALERMLGKSFIPPFDRNFHLKPFWQKIGVNSLFWNNEESQYKYTTGNKTVFINQDEYPDLDEPTSKHCFIVVNLIENPILERKKIYALSKRILELCSKEEEIKALMNKHLESLEKRYHEEERWKILGLLEKINYS